jgi:putative FmdB family regulatory protein
MPVYEYCCNTCHTQFELRQKFSDPPADRCPACGGIVRKIVSAVSFSLKGAGWFGDGYGTKSESPSSEGDTVASAGAATEAASTVSVPAGTTSSPAIQESAPTQTKTKSTAAETPDTSGDKTEVKPQ